MKRLILLIGFLAGVTTVHAQALILVDDAAKHAGDTVRVCTKIYGGKFMENSAGKITLLNAGASYPNALLTVVVPGKIRDNFTKKPEVFYTDKEVCITGVITIFRNKPQIVISSPEDIKVK